MMNSFIPKTNALANRVILVTGASQGIGRAAAKHFAAFGATVILLARNVKKLEVLYDEIETAGYPTPAIYPFNLATATLKDYQDLANNIENQLGGLDGLLHNAAQLGGLTPIEHYPIEQWHEILQINLTSPFLLTQATLPLLKKAKAGSIIFTIADEGLQGKAYWGAYGISKAGLNILMQTLVQELETNTSIRVNSVNPKKARTQLRLNAYPAEPSEGLPWPEELLRSYLYLMSDESIGINGQHFNAPL